MVRIVLSTVPRYVRDVELANRPASATLSSGAAASSEAIVQSTGALASSVPPQLAPNNATTFSGIQQAVAAQQLTTAENESSDEVVDEDGADAMGDISTPAGPSSAPSGIATRTRRGGRARKDEKTFGVTVRVLADFLARDGDSGQIYVDVNKLMPQEWTVDEAIDESLVGGGAADENPSLLGSPVDPTGDEFVGVRRSLGTFSARPRRSAASGRSRAPVDMSDFRPSPPSAGSRSKAAAEQQTQKFFSAAGEEDSSGLLYDVAKLLSYDPVVGEEDETSDESSDEEEENDPVMPQQELPGGATATGTVAPPKKAPVRPKEETILVPVEQMFCAAGGNNETRESVGRVGGVRPSQLPPKICEFCWKMEAAYLEPLTYQRYCSLACGTRLKMQRDPLGLEEHGGIPRLAWGSKDANQTLYDKYCTGEE